MIKAEHSIASSNDFLSAALAPSDESVPSSPSVVVTLGSMDASADPVLMTGQADPTYVTSVAAARAQIRMQRSVASTPVATTSAVVPVLSPERFPDRISNSILNVASQDQMPGADNERQRLWSIRQNRLDAIALIRDFPQPTTVAARWLQQRIEDMYGQDIDPDTTYLTRFKDGSMTSNAQGVPEVAYTLSEVAASGGDRIRGWKSRDIAELNTKFGLYMGNQPDASYDIRQQVRLHASEFRDLLSGYDRNLEYEHAVKIFWDQHKKEYRRLVAESFTLSLTQQYQDGKLSEDNLRLIEHAVQNANFQSSVFSFDLAGNRAADMLRFRNAETNGVVLYMPGQKYPFHEFKGEGKLREWIATLASSKDGREQIGSHFSNMQRELHGVDVFLKKLGSTPLERRKINQIDRFGTSGIMRDFLPRIALWGMEKSLQDAQFGIARPGAGNYRQQAVSVLAPLMAAPDSRTARVAMTVLGSQSLARQFDTFLARASARGLRKNKLNAVLSALSVPQIEDPVQIQKRLQRIRQRMAQVDQAYSKVALTLQGIFQPEPATVSVHSVRAARWTLKQAEALQEIGIPEYRHISASAWSEAIRQVAQNGVSAGKLNVRTLAEQALLLDRIPSHMWGDAASAA